MDQQMSVYRRRRHHLQRQVKNQYVVVLNNGTVSRSRHLPNSVLRGTIVHLDLIVPIALKNPRMRIMMSYHLLITHVQDHTLIPHHVHTTRVRNHHVLEVLDHLHTHIHPIRFPGMKDLRWINTVHDDGTLNHLLDHLVLGEDLCLILVDPVPMQVTGDIPLRILWHRNPSFRHLVLIHQCLLILHMQ